MKTAIIKAISLKPENFEKLEDLRGRKNRSKFVNELIERASSQPSKVGTMPASSTN